MYTVDAIPHEFKIDGKSEIEGDWMCSGDIESVRSPPNSRLQLPVGVCA